MSSMLTDGNKDSFLKTSRKIKRHQGQFLAIPLLHVYENSEDTYIKITCSCLLNISILSFSMQPLTESLYKVPKDTVQTNISLLRKDNLMQLCWTLLNQTLRIRITQKENLPEAFLFTQLLYSI